MARGMLAGITTGLVVSVLGLGTASLMMEPVTIGAAEPEAPVSDAPAPATDPAEAETQDSSTADDAGAADAPDADDPGPDGSEPTDEATTTPGADAPAMPEPVDGAPETEETPDSDRMDAPAPDDADTGAPAVDDTAPMPDAAGADAAPDMGDEVATAEPPDADAVSDATEDEAAPGTTVDDAPAMPDPDTVPDTSDADAGAPATTDGAPAPAMDDPAAPATDEDAPMPAAMPDDGMAPAVPGDEDDAGAPAMADSARDDPADTPAAEDETPAEQVGPVILAPVEPLPTAPAPGSSDAASAGGAEAPAAGADDADTTAAPAGAEPEDPADRVVTGRLPSIGAAEEPEPAPGAEPALTRNAIAFEVTGEEPLLSILLVDTGEDRAGMADLGKLPFPVTVAVDASALDAAEAIAFYRDQGAEVVTIVPLPEGATATDVDVSFEAYAPLLEDSVAAMTEAALGFQALGDGAVQVAVNLAETGHGLISWPAGLNTGHKAALKEGVAAGLVFRDLDSEGQAGPVIRRFLDNAAFRARNEAGVIVVARTRPETVQALLEWSLGTRAGTVTLAPISVVLAAQ